jgi:catechol 2,3-dioxygenase-like lactoylglutathione lyase family enzyme
MTADVHGIHHVTAIAGDPQTNVNFYVGLLGLRFVKKTVNFDAPNTYHFYYGDELGSPGTILTFFPWASYGPKGHPGTGQLTVISFSIPEHAAGYWAERLKRFNVDLTGPFTRRDEDVIVFHDPDGIELELVSSASDKRPAWENGEIPPERAIRGFSGVLLSEESHERTASLLTTTLGFRPVWESDDRFRHESGEGGPGTRVDVLHQPGGKPGRMGIGAVHHVAWRTQNDETQRILRQELVRLGYNVSPVMDRKYFHSIYFEEPGRVLFEVATDPPGFAVDEPLKNLGTRLMLPPWLEKDRAALERALPQIRVPAGYLSEVTS